MDLVGKLLDPKVTTASLDEAWQQLNPELSNALSMHADKAIDELDGMLSE